MMRILVLAGALAVASTASAQSVPNINAPKRAAERAVAKTNAQTLAMSMPDSVRSGASSSAPAAGAPGAASSEARAAMPAGSAANGPGSAAPRAGASGVAATPAAASARRAPADTAGKVVLRREVFAYDQGGRRDPFVSLMTVGELRPMISDLAVVGIVIDPSGRNSVAVLRDLGTKEQYRVRVGQQLGRMRVARIQQKSVTFTIEEFGYSRQQELALGDSNQARTK